LATGPSLGAITSTPFCPWAQRITLQIALNGLEDVIGVSYVDNSRDARGWAFRETNGPDPVNGFTLLRDAYELTEPGFDGHVSVPTLWDRETGRVVSNDYVSLGTDIATQFRTWSNGADTYPELLRAEIADLGSWIGPAVNRGTHQATRDDAARATLLDAFARLDPPPLRGPLPGRRAAHRGRHPAVGLPGPLPRPRTRPGPPPAAVRLPEPVGLRPPPLPAPRLPGDDRLHHLHRSDRRSPRLGNCPAGRLTA